MAVTCTKAEAAVRQLDVAINLLFRGGDPLAVRTLVGAAHAILADLVEHKCPGQSWRSRLIEDSGLSLKDALNVINGVSNFLKHADRDPEALLTYDEEETDHLLIFTTLECGELGRRQSIGMQAFQIWYLASYPGTLGPTHELVLRSQSAFSHLHSLPRAQKLSEGARFIDEMRRKYGDAA